MKRSLVILSLITSIVGWSAPAMASLISFSTTLLGANEVPPNLSPAFGFGTVLLDDVAGTITVDENWFDLTAPASASHIHGPAVPGSNGPVLFPFTGVPAATTGAIPEQTFSITPLQITQLEAGLFYMNVHNANFPGGEIRGQLGPAPVPEPATLALLGSGLVGLASRARRQRRK